MFRRRPRSRQPTSSRRERLEMVGFEGQPIFEFRTPDGRHVVLHEATCTDISFRPVDKQLVVTFADAIAGEADAVLTFDDACIYRWHDEGDGSEGLPGGWPADARGQVDIIEVDGDILLATLNVQVGLVASRVSYRIVEHRA